MKQPIIGIAGNHLLESVPVFQGNRVTYTPQGFIDAVKQANGLPLVLPINTPETAADYIQQIDKLLLAGGQDVSPQLYGEDPHLKLGNTNHARDLFEQALVKEALHQGKPIFAVCRGLQLVNVALGGTLYQDLSLVPHEVIKHEQQPTAPEFATHRLTVDQASQLTALLPEHYHVNSYHHQAIKKVAPSLRPIAWASDGIIEAIESKESHSILGVQWHPELTHTVSKIDQGLFDYFVQQMN
ncbi:MAG: gamma-glutamyl-gamma-aminobutyrate hydrolase family protein [Enterococcus sp.]